MRSSNPYYVTSADMACLSIEESETIWQKRRKCTSKLDLPFKTFSVPAPLKSPPSVHRQLGTPVQDENIWDTIMGPSQYSSHMTLTPPSVGLHSPASTLTHADVPVQPVPTTLPPSVLPGHRVCTSASSAIVQQPIDATTNVSLPAISTLISSSVMSVPRTTHSTAVVSTPVITSIYSPVSPFIISTCAELTQLRATITPSVTLSPSLPFIPGTSTLTQPLASGSDYHLQQAAVPAPQPSVTVDMFSSPSFMNTYNPNYPGIDQISYTPTPIVTSSATKQTVQHQSKAQQTDSPVHSPTNSSADLVAAVNDLNKTFHSSIATISKALENHNLILGTIHQQIKNYVRMGEEKRKRRYDEEPKEKEKYKEPKSKKHRE